MEKKSWLWKRKSSDRSPGETSESSGSISSHSERYSDEQEAVKGSPNHMQSPEVTSKVGVANEELNDTVKSLTEKLSAALVNVGAKEELVKQHSKVAEEAVAGWEKAENEVANIKQQHEAAVQQNLALEVRVNHLENALKECVRQLRQAREEQEQKILEAVAEKTDEWEFTKVELESQLIELQNQAEASKAKCGPSIDPNVLLKLESLEKENSILRHELLNQSEELEVRTIERDLSTQAAETSSKQQLESIKKVAKLEAECRRLQALARKSSLNRDHKAVSTSSLYVDSLTDSQSDSGEKLNSLEVDTHKLSKAQQNESEPSCSDSRVSALFADLDQFKSGKAMAKSVPSSPLDIDMDDFLEMERLAALPEANGQSKTNSNEMENMEHSLRAELQTMNHRVAELEDKLCKVETEKAELENALSMTQESLKASRAQLEKTDKLMEDLQIELTTVNESKQLLEQQLVSMEVESQAMFTKFDTLKAEVERERSISSEMTVKCQELEKELTRITEEVELQQSASSNEEKVKQVEQQLASMEVEARTMSTKFDTLKAEVERERSISSEMTVKCQELEKELTRKTEEIELQQSASSNEVKVKQEELAVVAADRLAECQKTISSLAIQLKSLATLEDFLIDTANLPGFSGGGSETPKANGVLWNLRSNDAFKCDPDPSNNSLENSPAPLMNGKTESSPPSSSSSSSSAVSLNHVSHGKSKSGFGKLFSRSKSQVQLENHQGQT